MGHREAVTHALSPALLLHAIPWHLLTQLAEIIGAAAIPATIIGGTLVARHLKREP